MPAGMLLPPGYTMRKLLEVNKDTKVSIWIGTYAEYTALASKDSSTLYFFTEGDPAVDIFNTLSVTDKTTCDYTKVTSTVSGAAKHDYVDAGLYMVHVVNTTTGVNTRISFMMDLVKGNDWVSPSLGYDRTSSDGTVYVKAEYESSNGKFQLKVVDATRNSTHDTNFEVSVRRIGEKYTT